ncbi:MAG TPA: DUF1330 domain-containing protein [Pseudonocardiaceae bacterium]|nr:DUF1330 domain-containing protein [Pseudonocardiaceae bacterium]
MSAYVIVEVDIDDPVGYQEYRLLATASVARHGGRYVARGGPTETFEGEWSGRVVVIEFDSLDAARAWYHFADYQEALPLRQRASRGRVIAVEGT